MKNNNRFLIIFLFLIISLLTKASVNDTLRLATYNIRVDTSSDTGNRDWGKRKAHVADVIKNLYQFDIFGVQELTSPNQQNELMAYLSDTYNIFARAIGNTAGTSGARNAIIFRKDRFTPRASGFFFLSETPSVAGIGWDARLNRNCLWLRMKDNNTNAEFYFFSTHFDHVGAEARRQSAKLIVAKIKEINTDNLPVIVVGDLNAQSDKIPISNLLNGGLLDSRTLVTSENIFGPVGTTNGWNRPVSELTNRIDFILVTPQVKVLSYTTISQKYYSDAYPSDHFPVMVKAFIPNETSNIPAVLDGKMKVVGKDVHISGNPGKTLQAYNISGMKVKDIRSLSDNEIIGFADAGVYILGIEDNAGSASVKVLIR